MIKKRCYIRGAPGATLWQTRVGRGIDLRDKHEALNYRHCTVCTRVSHCVPVSALQCRRLGYHMQHVCVGGPVTNADHMQGAATAAHQRIPSTHKRAYYGTAQHGDLLKL
jgi:hypothetical protein